MPSETVEIDRDTLKGLERAAMERRGEINKASDRERAKELQDLARDARNALRVTSE